MLVGTAFVSGVPAYTGVNTTVYALEEKSSAVGDFEYYTMSDGTVKITAYNGDDKKVVIPSEIDPFCFTVIDNLVIPYGVKTIKSLGDYVESVTIDENNQYFSSQDGALFNKDKTELIKFLGNTYEGEYVIPEGVTAIAESAFEKMNSSYQLKKITLPDSLKTIGEYAFYSCDDLSEIENLDNVEYIGYRTLTSTQWYDEYYENQPDGTVYIGKTLYDYKGEIPANTSVSVNDGTKNITHSVFEMCDGLVSLSIPASVENIDEYIVMNCNNLAEITVDENNQNYSTQDGVLFDKAKTKLIACPSAKTGEYTIPDSVVEIGTYAFSACAGLTNITIPDSVEKIDHGAFYDSKWYDDFYKKQSDGAVYIGNVLYAYKGDCYELTSIEIKDGTKGITDNAFSDCESLADVTIPNSVKSIGESAFYNTGLKSVTIPSSVDYIGDHAFGYCYYEAAATDFSIHYTPCSFVIKGQKGTAAEAYADDNAITFVLAGSDGEQSTESAVQSSESSNTSTNDVPTGDSILPIFIAVALAAISGMTAVVFVKSIRKKNEQ